MYFFKLHVFANIRILTDTAKGKLSNNQSLIKSCLWSRCLLAVCLICLCLCPLKLTTPLSHPLLRSLQGKGALRDTVRRVTRALTIGVTRDSLHFMEVQESHKASRGIYEGGGRATRLVRGGRGERYRGMLLLLKATNFEKRHTHTRKST